MTVGCQSVGLTVSIKHCLLYLKYNTLSWELCAEDCSQYAMAEFFFFYMYVLRHFTWWQWDGLYLKTRQLQRMWFSIIQYPHLHKLCLLHTNTALEEMGGKALLKISKSSGKLKWRQWREGGILKLHPCRSLLCISGSPVKRCVHIVTSLYTTQLCLFAIGCT